MKVLKSIKNIQGKFKDEIGYFKRELELKRLEKYANEIDIVLTKYNKKSCEETMMVKGPRRSSGETTNRKIHQEDLEKIVIQIAKGIGLNQGIVAIMGKHHDIGHTFLGHSGEWWISSIQEDYGIGYTCHNTVGAKNLIFTNDVNDEIINKIKVHNPKISEKQLKKIRKSLWIIIDGINTHNGETISKEYVPDILKTEEIAKQEIVNCCTKEGYDREVTPASIQACLMRLADQISYIPLDLLDGLREGLIRDEEGNIVSQIDDDYIQILTKMGITIDEIQECNQTGVYTTIAERLKEILINDVIKNSTKKKITMSEIIFQMNELKKLNGEKIVNNVVLIEDQQTYPRAIRTLMERYKTIIIQNGLLDRMQNMNKTELLQQYKGNVDEPFIQYICCLNNKDFELNVEIAQKATRNSIEAEQEIARKCVLEGVEYKDKEEFGLDYTLKNNRIKRYIQYYEKQLKEGKMIGYDDKRRQEDIQIVMDNIDKGMQNPNYVSKEERVALILAKEYISTLNDKEFLKLLEDTKIIDNEQKKSLTRKYKDIPNLLDEVYEANVWKELKKSQEREGEMLASSEQQETI